MNKICKKKNCSEINPQSLENFVVDNRYRDGYQNRCKSCQKKYDTSRFRLKREKLLLQSKAYYSSNIDKARAGRNEYRKTHKTEQAILESTWRKNNPGKAREKVRRYQAAKLNATPGWLSEDQIKEMQRFYETCPETHEVDHITPLQGHNVCGLHVPWNLQHLSVYENRSKKNKY
jgi:hypothetical protein